MFNFLSNSSLQKLIQQMNEISLEHPIREKLIKAISKEVQSTNMLQDSFSMYSYSTNISKPMLNTYQPFETFSLIKSSFYFVDLYKKPKIWLYCIILDLTQSSSIAGNLKYFLAICKACWISGDFDGFFSLISAIFVRLSARGNTRSFSSLFRFRISYFSASCFLFKSTILLV